MTETTIAETLAADGRFGWADCYGTKSVYDETCDYAYREEFGRWLNADEAESMLAAVGLQVVWSDYREGGMWCLCRVQTNYGQIQPVTITRLEEIPKGQRTHANNAGAAWIIKTNYQPGLLDQWLKERAC